MRVLKQELAERNEELTARSEAMAELANENEATVMELTERSELHEATIRALKKELEKAVIARSSDQDVGLSSPVKALGGLLLAFSPAGTWTSTGLRPILFKNPSAVVSANPRIVRPKVLRANAANLGVSPVDAPTKPIDGTDAEDDIALKNLADKVITCSAASQRDGRFGSAKPYVYGKEECIDAIERLETEFEKSPLDMSNLPGRWQLIFTNDAVTRSSPFFWVVKDLFETDTASYILDRSTRVRRDLSSRDLLSGAFFGTLDTLGFGTSFGNAYQTIEDDRLVSEVEVKGSAGLFVVTTSGRWKSSEDRSLEITVETTQAAKSDLDDLLPGFLPDIAKIANIKFPSGLMFESIKPGSSTTMARLTFLSDDLRVTRHEENIYVYRKISEPALGIR
mmetsp:Transcript_81848/g.144952  ORF Transcript_81848/g.144952 Transcript_81848/m.144952 type:complete len:396 (+) Transcript_81848:67-1254(+)